MLLAHLPPRPLQQPASPYVLRPGSVHARVPRFETCEVSGVAVGVYGHYLNGLVLHDDEAWVGQNQQGSVGRDLPSFPPSLHPQGWGDAPSLPSFILSSILFSISSQVLGGEEHFFLFVFPPSLPIDTVFDFMWDN